MEVVAELLPRKLTRGERRKTLTSGFLSQESSYVEVDLRREK
jgi:hypothetical protein